MSFFYQRSPDYFPPSKPVMELNQNHRYDHSLNVWASLDLQPSIMYSPNLLIGPHLSPKSKCCWIWRLFLTTEVIQSSIFRSLRLWGNLVLTESNHSWPFSKQNRKEKLELYPLVFGQKISFCSRILLANTMVWGKTVKIYKVRKLHMSLRICPLASLRTVSSLDRHHWWPLWSSPACHVSPRDGAGTGTLLGPLPVDDWMWSPCFTG